VLAALLAAAVALASAGPLADLWNSRLPSRLRELGAVGTSEGARLERFLGPTWTFYRSVVERSPPEVPVVLVLPLSPAALLVWDQFSSLLFPKAVVPFVPEGRFIPPDFFGKYEIKYDNTVDGVLALTGPDFDVVLVPGEKPPDGIAIAEVLHETQWFVLARGADVRGATTRPR
jgi:hypothetical protein